MIVTTENTIQTGQQFAGFEIKAITPLKALQVKAYQIEHLATGAKILHLHNEDAENLFSLVFLLLLQMIQEFLTF